MTSEFLKPATDVDYTYRCGCVWTYTAKTHAEMFLIVDRHANLDCPLLQPKEGKATRHE